MQAEECVLKSGWSYFLYFLTLLTMNVTVSCSVPKASSSARVRVELRHKTAKQKATKHSLPALPLSDPAQPPPYAPLEVSSFNCFFINVMGPDIGDWVTNEKGIQKTPGASYFSLYSQMINPDIGGIAELSVPNGSQRIFQAIGVVSTQKCPQTLTTDQIANGSVFKGMFEVGRVTLDVSQDLSIRFESTYDPVTAKDARILFMPKSSDTQAPTLSSGIKAKRTDESVSLTWPAASDNATPANFLLYTLISSGSSIDAINSVQKAQTAGTTVVDWTLALTSYVASRQDTYIVYTVLVKDAAGNISQYAPIEVFGFPQLSYAGVNGALILGTPVTLTPTTLNANGTPILSCAVKSGSVVLLPSWASINQNTCVITGTPNAILSTETLTIIATNLVGNSQDATLVISVSVGVSGSSYRESSGNIESPYETASDDPFQISAENNKPKRIAGFYTRKTTPGRDAVCTLSGPLSSRWKIFFAHIHQPLFGGSFNGLSLCWYSSQFSELRIKK